MKYKIISSGSKGNCVVINDIMVDCGLPFAQVKDDLYDVKYLLITHTHSDHLKLQTIQTIKKLFPRIIIVGNFEVAQILDVDVIANAGFDIKLDDYIITPFECIHDVLTYGYVWEFEGQRIIYATDTAHLDNAPDGQYDYFFIESNHDEQKLELARNEYKGGYNPFFSGKRHLSTQAAKTFYYMRRRTTDAILEELHKSLRFY